MHAPGPTLQICLCSHNPRLEMFSRVLTSIARQTCKKNLFELVIIDNASEPPISEARCRHALGPAIALRIEREPTLGLAAARVRAITATTAEWLLFVDDDTELLPDYVTLGLRIIDSTPGLGCFGGKLLLPPHLRTPGWAQPLLGFLAIRDMGDQAIVACSDKWGPWEPPGAGAFVRRPVLERYCHLLRAERGASDLGWRGNSRRVAGEDSLMMRGAHAVGLAASYQPGLQLVHHIEPDRLRFGSFLSIMYGHGRGRSMLERLLRGDIDRRSMFGHLISRRTWRAITTTLRQSRGSLRYTCCMLAYRLGYVFNQIE